MRMSKKIQVWRKSGQNNSCTGNVSADSTTNSETAAKSSGKGSQNSSGSRPSTTGSSSNSTSNSSSSTTNYRNNNNNSSSSNNGGGGGSGSKERNYSSSSSSSSNNNSINSSNSSGIGSVGDDTINDASLALDLEDKEERKYVDNFRQILELRSKVYSKMNWWPRHLFVPEPLLQHPAGQTTEQQSHQSHRRRSDSPPPATTPQHKPGGANKGWDPQKKEPLTNGHTPHTPTTNGHSAAKNGHSNNITNGSDGGIPTLDNSGNPGDDVDVTSLPYVTDGLSSE